MQLQNEWVDQKLARAVKKGIMMARLLADNFERFHGTGTHQQRRGSASSLGGAAREQYAAMEAGGGAVAAPP